MTLTTVNAWVYLGDCAIIQELGGSGLRVSSPKCASSDDDDNLVEPEDFATDLDAPEPPITHEQELLESPSPAEQLADVSPQLDEPDESAEPRPGC